MTTKTQKTPSVEEADQQVAAAKKHRADLAEAVKSGTGRAVTQKEWADACAAVEFAEMQAVGARAAEARGKREANKAAAVEFGKKLDETLPASVAEVGDRFDQIIEDVGAFIVAASLHNQAWEELLVEWQKIAQEAEAAPDPDKQGPQIPAELRELRANNYFNVDRDGERDSAHVRVTPVVSLVLAAVLKAFKDHPAFETIIPREQARLDFITNDKAAHGEATSFIATAARLRAPAPVVTDRSD